MVRFTADDLRYFRLAPEEEDERGTANSQDAGVGGRKKRHHRFHPGNKDSGRGGDSEQPGPGVDFWGLRFEGQAYPA